MLKHKNSLNCLIFELNFLSHVYISMQNVKTIFEDFYKIYKYLLEYFNMFFWPSFWPRLWLTGQVGRPQRSTEPRAGRPLRSTDVHSHVHVWQTQGRPTGRSTGPESSALCIWAVGRAVGRDGPTVIFMTVGGRPGGRPGCKNSQRLVFWRGLFKPHFLGILRRFLTRKISPFFGFKNKFLKCFRAQKIHLICFKVFLLFQRN